MDAIKFLLLCYFVAAPIALAISFALAIIFGAIGRSIFGG